MVILEQNFILILALSSIFGFGSKLSDTDSFSLQSRENGKDQSAKTDVNTGKGELTKKIDNRQKSKDSEAPQKSLPIFAFGVMVYQKKDHSPEQTFHLFRQLMSEIYDSNHIYIIHVDIKSDSQLLHWILDYYCRGVGNSYAPDAQNVILQSNTCFTIRPRNVAWAGISTIEMMLALIQTAFDTRKPWDYFIFIGHESVALTTIPYLQKLLLQYPRGSNFLNCWQVDGYEFFGQKETIVGRMREVWVDTLQGDLVFTGLNNHRIYPFDRENPTSPPFTIYKSIQLCVISREFSHYAVYGPDTKMLLVYLATIRTADEMFFPTLLLNHPQFATTAICNSTLHLTHWIRPGGSWHPEYLTMEHLPLLLETQLPFARKVSVSPQSIDSEDALLSLRAVLGRIRLEFRNNYYKGEHNLLRDRRAYFESNDSLWLKRSIMAYLHGVLQDTQVLAVDEIRGNLTEANLLISEQQLPQHIVEELRVIPSEDMSSVTESAVVDAASDQIKSHLRPGTNALRQLERNSSYELIMLLDRIRRARDSRSSREFQDRIRWLREKRLERRSEL